MFDPEEPRHKPQPRYVKPSLRGLRRDNGSSPVAEAPEPQQVTKKADVAVRNGASLTPVKPSAEGTAIKLARVKQIEAETDKIVAETELLMAQADKEMASVKQIHAEIADSRQAIRRQAEKEEIQVEADELMKHERIAVRNLSFLCACISVLFVGLAIVMLAHGNPAFALPAGVFAAFVGMTLKLSLSLPQKPEKGDR